MALREIKGNIVDLSVRENGLTYVKVAVGDHVLGSASNKDSITDIENSEDIELSEFKSRIIKSSGNTSASIKAAPSYAALIGDHLSRIITTEKHGNFIVGPTTFTAHPSMIRINGIYKFNGLITSTMPSTIVTPVPVLEFDFNLYESLKNLKSNLQQHLDLLLEY